ncbi:uncharacterized protein LOC132608117 [Lycium barbarum]|uniref:uncharacterized protein LOC132608117 n=1 Tax=Lycium barbarum TaxID=112863 RepID=UPI00293E9F25|nr:uncharacterized protein LOC132608117 [Lycium barbarum]
METELKTSKDRYRPYSRPDRSGFRMDRGRIDHNHSVVRKDRRNDCGSGSRGLQFRNNPVVASDIGESSRLSEYNFNVDANAIVSAIGHIKDVRWLRPLRTGPAQQDLNAMCDYHGTHGHRIADCRQLRDEVARLLKNDHLHEFLSDGAKGHYKGREANKKAELMKPQHVINIIIGGVEVPQGPMMKKTKVSITRETKTRDYVPEGFISFSDKDTEGAIQPHNNALVISVLINKSQVKRILIEPGSSASIIRWKVVEQLGLLDQIMPKARVLNGFNMACETTKGEITLPVNTAGIVQHNKFYVIDS